VNQAQGDSEAPAAQAQASNPSIERTSSSELRSLPPPLKSNVRRLK